MRLLVSVVDAAEALAAAAAGASIVDVKDPAEGALGAPAPRTLAAIAAAVPDAELSVALGDLPQLPHTAALAAVAAADLGARTVKVGLRGSRDADEATAMLAAVAEALAGRDVAVVAAGYADLEGGGDRVGPRGGDGSVPAAAASDALSLGDLVEAADRARVRGCMLDTLVKDGRGLLAHRDADALTAFVMAGHACGLEVGLAGQVRLGDLPAIRATGADLVGVRSAVCTGGDRAGTIDAGLVRDAVAACAADVPAG